jgi:hypothetical protein
MSVQIYDLSVTPDMSSIVGMALSRQSIRERPNLRPHCESAEKPMPITSLESQVSISIGAGEALNFTRSHGGRGGALGSSCQETFLLEKKSTFVAGDKENRSQRGEDEKTNCERNSWEERSTYCSTRHSVTNSETRLRWARSVWGSLSCGMVLDRLDENRRGGRPSRGCRCHNRGSPQTGATCFGWSGSGVSHRESDRRSRIESILIEISFKSNDHILRGAAIANLRVIRGLSEIFSAPF